MGLRQRLVLILVGAILISVTDRGRAGTALQHNYGEALSKSILFFEGQRSGKLPPTQRMTWRKDSALQDFFLVPTTSHFSFKVDYILGSNPLNMSYMVGYGPKFPRRIHHRASSLPSIDQHPGHIDCKGGSFYFESQNPNPNLLLGAVVGGPDIKDSYADSRADFVHSEPTTYINAPLVGVLAYFKSHPS